MRETPDKLQLQVLNHVRRVVGVTYVGLWIERLALAFWPAATIAAAALAILLLLPFDVVFSAFTPAMIGILSGLALLTFLAALIYGGFTFKRPQRSEARARVDEALHHRPLQALSDSAVGSTHASTEDGAQSLWAQHQRRMLDAAKHAKAIPPRINLRHSDPFALRLMALTLLCMGLLFGTMQVRAPQFKTGTDVAEGPLWEGWIEPPEHARQPTYYLADLPDRFSVPQGARVAVYFYGDAGELTLRESVTKTGAQPVAQDSRDAPSPQSGVYDFTVETAGDIEIRGETGRVWSIALARNEVPTARFTAPMTRGAAGAVHQDYTLTDDVAVVRAVMTIALDVPRVVRQYGFAQPPETRSAIEIDVPLLKSGAREQIDGRLSENFAEHAFANLPVSISLQAWDGAGQSSEIAESEVILYGRQFFDPLAAALIDIRSELLWSRSNATRAHQILRAVSHAPEGMFDRTGPKTEPVLAPIDERLRDLADQIAEAGENMSDEAQTQVAAALWEIAIELEDGDLAEALERLRRAQERLAQAIKDGASAEDIARLMEELKAASEDYIRHLAEQQPEQDADGEQSGDSLEMSTDQLQEMMDRIQELMEQGRMTEAQRLLEALQAFLENMRVQQGNGAGESAGGRPSDAIREQLEETLREQQDLSDETFEQLQRQFDPEAESETGSENEAPNRDLQQRQQGLREGLRDGLPDQSTPQAGEDDALGSASGAMSESEEALEGQDYAEALRAQAEALEALRQGVRELAEDDADAGENNAEGAQDPSGRDPLGRDTSGEGRGLAGEVDGLGDTEHSRAQDLSDDVRRRAQEGRDARERDFLERLLKTY